MAGADPEGRFWVGLDPLGVVLEARWFPEGTRTAVDAAAALGCRLEQIVKSLVLAVGDRRVLVLCSGINRLDLGRVADELGVAVDDVRMATPDETRAATGQVIGGVAPFGHPEQLLTFVDPHLAGLDEVWAAAGAPHAVFPIRPDLLIVSTVGRLADVTAR